MVYLCGELEKPRDSYKLRQSHETNNIECVDGDLTSGWIEEFEGFQWSLSQYPLRSLNSIFEIVYFVDLSV